MLHSKRSSPRTIFVCAPPPPPLLLMQTYPPIKLNKSPSQGIITEPSRSLKPGGTSAYGLTGYSSERKLTAQLSHQALSSMSPGEFRARETELRAASAARWAEDERFSLENAFGLQLKRLEVRPRVEVFLRTRAERGGGMLLHCTHVEVMQLTPSFTCIHLSANLHH